MTGGDDPGYAAAGIPPATCTANAIDALVELGRAEAVRRLAVKPEDVHVEVRRKVGEVVFFVRHRSQANCQHLQDYLRDHNPAAGIRPLVWNTRP